MSSHQVKKYRKCVWDNSFLIFCYSSQGQTNRKELGAIKYLLIEWKELGAMNPFII
jgi:hypothetical protein